MDFQNYRIEKLQKVDSKIKKIQHFLSKNYPNKKRFKKHMKLFAQFENERQNQQNQIYRNEILQKEVESVKREVNELELMISLEKENAMSIKKDLNFFSDRISDLNNVNSSLVETLIDSRKVNEEVENYLSLDHQIFSQGSALKLNMDRIPSTEDMLSDVDSSKETNSASTDEEEEEEEEVDEKIED